MNVLYIVNVPSPYMVNYFNELGKYCNLTVLFEKSTSSERDKSWKSYSFTHFKGIILKGISTGADTAFCPQVLLYLKRRVYDYIICTSMATPTGILAIEYMKLLKIPFYLESEGGFAKNGRGFKEKVKHFIMSGAAGYFSTTSVDDTYFLTYGATKERIFRYPFTSLYEKDLLPAPPSYSEKENLRKELAIPERKVILSVGQFIHRKGFDLLIESASNLADPDVGVYFVGGVPTQDYLSQAEQLGLNNIHFVGFAGKDLLWKYYQAADIFVLPTREDTWGLVINEAMACCLPVITTERCVAGLALVSDDNGKLIPIENVEALTSAICSLLSPETDLPSMAISSRAKIRHFTFENMAKVHMDFFRNGTQPPTDTPMDS